MIIDYKCLIVDSVFSHLGFWSGNLFLIAPFPDLCLLVPFHSRFGIQIINHQENPLANIHQGIPKGIVKILFFLFLIIDKICCPMYHICYICGFFNCSTSVAYKTHL